MWPQLREIWAGQQKAGFCCLQGPRLLVLKVCVAWHQATIQTGHFTLLLHIFYVVHQVRTVILHSNVNCIKAEQFSSTCQDRPCNAPGTWARDRLSAPGTCPGGQQTGRSLHQVPGKEDSRQAGVYNTWCLKRGTANRMIPTPGISKEGWQSVLSLHLVPGAGQEDSRCLVPG